MFLASLTDFFSAPGQLTLRHPLWLLAWLAIPLVLWLRQRRRTPVFIVPFAAAWHRPSLAASTRWPLALATCGILLLIGALARPQRVEDRREVRVKGYDLMLCIDLSGSMRSEDYIRMGTRTNRLDAIRPVVKAFIDKRPNDRIGVVVFAGHAYTLAPLTFDHTWLAAQVDRLTIGKIEDGTAIGDGLGVALTRLDQAAHETAGQRLGAFVILLTDGDNNRGSLSPDQAAEIAKSRNIPVYTMAAGKTGWVPVPVAQRADGSFIFQNQFSRLDESSLRHIASLTGGKFFRVDDVDTVENAFAAIDQARKIEFQAKSHLTTTELFHWLAFPGAALLLLSALAPRRPS